MTIRKSTEPHWDRNDPETWPIGCFFFPSVLFKLPSNTLLAPLNTISYEFFYIGLQIEPRGTTLQSYLWPLNLNSDGYCETITVDESANAARNPVFGVERTGASRKERFWLDGQGTRSLVFLSFFLRVKGRVLRVRRIASFKGTRVPPVRRDRCPTDDSDWSVRSKRVGNEQRAVFFSFLFFSMENDGHFRRSWASPVVFFAFFLFFGFWLDVVGDGSKQQVGQCRRDR